MIMNYKSTTTTSCFFIIITTLLSFHIFMSSNNNRSVSRRSSLDSIHAWSIVRALGFLLIAGLVVVLVRTTIVTWITVLVMLSFAGKRRRVLAVEGRKISGDVAVHLLKVLVKERSLVAVACATVLSSMAMVLVA